MTTQTPTSGLPPAFRLVKESTTEQIAELIQSSVLFQALDPVDVAVLARFLSLYNVDSGGVVFHEGDTGEFMGLIVGGIVELFKDGPAAHPVKIAAESSGRLLGEMALLDGEPRSATARFAQSGQVLILTKENFQRLLHEHPRAAANFLFHLSRSLSRRLRKTTGQLTNFLK